MGAGVLIPITQSLLGTDREHSHRPIRLKGLNATILWVYGLGQRRWLSVIANAARCPTPITNDISNTQVGVEKNQLLELTFPPSLAVSDRFHAVPPLARRWVVLLVIV